MTSASKPRLYNRPQSTLETLRSVISGSKTPEEIADDIDVSVRTVHNKVHDPLHLGLIENNDGEYGPTKEARRLIQLEDNGVLRDRFVELPGVDDVLDRIENGGATVEEVGRIISFETESGAAEKETFKRYGKVYARWLEHLDLGKVDEIDSEPRHPLEHDQGASSPRVPPQKVIEALRVIDDADTYSELADKLGYSERETKKILSTAYALKVAQTERKGSFTTSETGRKITTMSRGKQREVFRENLLEMPIVRAYCNRVPSGEFTSTEVMEQVSDEYSMGWSETTISTKANRLSPWLTFTQMAEKDERGVLKAAEKMPSDDLPDP